MDSSVFPPPHSSRSVVRIQTRVALLLGAARASLWPPPSLCRLGSPRTGTRLNQTAPCIGQAPAPFLTVNARKSDPKVSDTGGHCGNPPVLVRSQSELGEL